MITIYKIYAFIFGAIVGSFFNVVILRVPKEQDIVFQKSHCPKCKQEIKWYDNIPLISMLWLHFKCRFCQQKISYRYFVIELICGLTALALFPNFIDASTLVSFVIYFFIFCLLLAHFVIDWEHQILPDGINVFLFLFFTILIFLQDRSWGSAFLGLAIGYGFTFGITWLFYKLRGQIGLGGGDIKLFAVLGWYVGPMDILYIIVFSSLLGAIVSLLLIALKKMNKEQPIAFGPAIIIVASIKLYFPQVFDSVTRSLFLY